MAVFVFNMPVQAQGRTVGGEVEDVADSAFVPTIDPTLPTPTPPSLDSPNLHLQVVDGAGQPLGGIRLKIFAYPYNKTTGKYELHQVLEGQTALDSTGDKAGPGWASFDATPLLHGLYYVQMNDKDGNLILPTDPNGPRVGTGGQPDPVVDYTMSMLDLFEGNVVYVFHFELHHLLAGPVKAGTPTPSDPTWQQAKLAVLVSATRKNIYYAPASSSLSKVPTALPSTPTPSSGGPGNNPSGSTSGSSPSTGPNSAAISTTPPAGSTPSVSPTVTPGTNGTIQPTSAATNPTSGGGQGSGSQIGSFNSLTPSGTGPGGASGSTAGSVATPEPVVTVGSAVVPGLGSGSNAGIVTSAVDPRIAVPVNNPAQILPTSTPLPTPTSSYTSCERGCVRTEQAADYTASAATIRAALTAGVYTPDPRDVGRNGGGQTYGGGGGNPTQVSSLVGPGTASTSGSNNPQSAGGSQPGSAKPKDNSDSGGPSILAILGLVGAVVCFLVIVLGRRLWPTQSQSQGQGQGQGRGGPRPPSSPSTN